ncbi:Histone-lysine N-methyltransferase SETMAR, partial [Habropoda laboriosa]
LVNKKNSILLHDNVRPHVASTTVEKFHQLLGIEVLLHTPYSPDLSSTDFHFFGSLDNFFTQKRFRKHEVIENVLQQVVVFF